MNRGSGTAYAILIPVVFLAGVAAISLLAVRHLDVLDTQPEERRQKVLRRTIAKDINVGGHGLYGVDLVRCRSCRIEKRKQGLFTLGGLNVLVLEGLSVVLPPASTAQKDGELDQPSSMSQLARDLGVSDGFLSARGVAPKFSGLKVLGLSVSRLVDGNKSEKAFSAQTAEAVRGGLKLKDCVIYAEGESPRPVAGAMLARAGGKLCLSWDGGRMDLN